MPDNRYRDVKELIHQLVDIVSLGGNYLLNVGPDPRGVIPAEAQERLRGIGAWMTVNSESIYATRASPFPVKPSWGRITARDDALYLHVYQWNESITLTGIKSRVMAVTLLADPGPTIQWTQEPCGSLGYDRLAIHLPSEAPDASVSVLKVQFGKDMELETRIIEDDAGCIELPACLASIQSSAGRPQATVNVTGIAQKWFSTEESFGWEFLCAHPGEFHATITISTDFHGVWDFGHEVVVSCDGQENRVQIEDTGIPTAGFQKRTFQAGRFRIEQEGLRRLSIKASRLSRANGKGFQMSSIHLRPTRG
jgi:alpha-L-fucosidase